MLGLPHYHFHFKIGLQNPADSVTHLSFQHTSTPCVFHTETHTTTTRAGALSSRAYRKI